MIAEDGRECPIGAATGAWSGRRRDGRHTPHGDLGPRGGGAGAKTTDLCTTAPDTGYRFYRDVT